MSGNMSAHLDEFTLLRYAASDLDGRERETADDHLHVCKRCVAALSAMEELDQQLRAITGDFAPSGDLDPADPFARRPETLPRPPGKPRTSRPSLSRPRRRLARRAAASSRPRRAPGESWILSCPARLSPI